MSHWLPDDRFSCFSITPSCDGQTEYGRTELLYQFCTPHSCAMLPRGNNDQNVLKRQHIYRPQRPTNLLAIWFKGSYDLKAQYCFRNGLRLYQDLHREPQKGANLVLSVSQILTDFNAVFSVRFRKELHMWGTNFTHRTWLMLLH